MRASPGSGFELQLVHVTVDNLFSGAALGPFGGRSEFG